MSDFTRLRLARQFEGLIQALSLPEDYHFREIPFGFQIVDGPYEEIKESPGFSYGGEVAYTVLMSPGQHLRTEIMVIYSGVDGDLKLLQKGSIYFENDEDLRWIEKILNSRWEEHRSRVNKFRVPQTVPEAKWAEMAELVKANPKVALQNILKALG